MSVSLEIEGMAQQQAPIALRAGEVAVVGRSPWADVSLPPESELADEHFRIDCRHAVCRVESVTGTVLRNGVKTEAAVLADGDLLSAGQLRFHVKIFGLTDSRLKVDDADSPGVTAQPVDGFMQLLDRARISEDGQTCVIANDRLGTLDALLTSGLRKDACRFAVACLPRVVAMEWAVQQMGGVAGLSQDDRGRLLAFISGEREAPAAAEIDERIAVLPNNSPAAWIWKAARWSNGSLSGPGLPFVSPPPHLFALAISVAMSLAATQQDQDVFGDGIAEARELIKENNHAAGRSRGR